MTVLVKELRDAPADAWASGEKVDAAAVAVIRIDRAATKADLVELKADLTFRFAMVRFAQASAIVALIKPLPA